MATEKKSSGSVIVNVVVGIALMIGGYWLSQNWHPGFLKTFEEQGIPIDLGKTASVIGVFLILFPVIKMFFLNPLADAILARNAELESTFAQAESLRTEITQMRTEYEQRIASTEAAAREQIQNQIKEAQNLRTQLMAEAQQKSDELLKKAQEDIERERVRLMSDLRSEVVNLTLLATERIIGQNVDDTKNRQLVQDFIDKVEVPT